MCVQADDGKLQRGQPSCMSGVQYQVLLLLTGGRLKCPSSRMWSMLLNPEE